LKFSEFLGSLQEEFSSDSSHQHRVAWQKVKLDQTLPLTGEKWKKFQRDFELRKGRDFDWTENEEYDLLYNQLLENYQIKVSLEESKRRKDQFWVKVTRNLGNMKILKILGIFDKQFRERVTILRILRKKNLAPEIPEDLYHLMKRAVSIRKHIEKNKRDKDSKYRLILVESKIHRLVRYYKLTKNIPSTWRYDYQTALALVS
jgi:ribosomal protein S15P/S13E